VMSVIARTFGGLRTGDLHSLRWDAFDLPSKPGANDGFAFGWAPRQKTKRPQRLAVPEVGRYALEIWWDHAGNPRGGLVFPSRRGDRKGEPKLKVSHAEAFRRDLRRAWGIEAWDAKRGAFVQIREPSQRERIVLEGDASTLPVDFHSWRRRYAQALADAGLSAQQAALLSGHATLSQHGVYLARATQAVTAPDAAIPKILPEGDVESAARTSEVVDGGVNGEKANDFSGADGTRTRGLRRDRPAL